jgi:cytoskeletal protein CcmA (bactofilin family)
VRDPGSDVSSRKRDAERQERRSKPVRGKTIAGGGELSGFLDVGTDFKGEIAFQDTLRIDGKFEGSIRDGKLLIVGETADVNADIDVVTISVSGRLRGNVHARERIELHESARCQCNLETRVLVVEEGALFEGNCSMQSTQVVTRELSPVATPDKVKTFARSE